MLTRKEILLIRKIRIFDLTVKYWNRNQYLCQIVRIHWEIRKNEIRDCFDISCIKPVFRKPA